jgi:hypothetical protein
MISAGVESSRSWFIPCISLIPFPLTRRAPETNHRKEGSVVVLGPFRKGAGSLEKWDASLFPASTVAAIERPEIGKRPNFSRVGRRVATDRKER